MRITPLDSWVSEITEGDINLYQLKKINETLKTAQKGFYYREYLPSCIKTLDALAELPTIGVEVLRQTGTGLVCVPQGEISRVVTLQTSGSTGVPKRVYFTAEDQELTVDYFSHGLPTVVSPGETMAIHLPCERPGGVGSLIAKALLRIPVTPVRYGLVEDLKQCAETLINNAVNSIVGTPVQTLALARYCAANNLKPDIRSVLLSTDNIPRVIVSELGKLWGCEVYEHYGMTETGLGGAIDCDAHDGYHIRENDLLFEVLDENGNRLPDGSYGELTFTTLTRRGMPLIRYRTGDITKIISGKCDCGSMLRRIAPIAGRIDGDVVMECGTVIRIRDFDEVLFALPQVCDFRIYTKPDKNILKIEAETQKSIGNITEKCVENTLLDSGLISGLKTEISIVMEPDILTKSTGKRMII